MAKSRKKTSHKKRLVTLITGGIVIVVLAAFGIYHLAAGDKKPNVPAQTANTTTGSQVNLDPPTEAEKQASDDSKDKLNQPTPAAPTTSDGRTKVTPVIASADKNGASAYVPGIFEEGGICTATFTHGGDSITTTSSGFQNSNYTSCAPLQLQSPLNIHGDWTVTVSYSSTKSTGNSAAFGPLQVQ